MDVFTDGLERVPVREHLVIGDNDKGGNAQFMQAHPVLQGTKVMADMQAPRGPIPGEDFVFLRIFPQLFSSALLLAKDASNVPYSVCSTAIVSPHPFLAHGFVP